MTEALKWNTVIVPDRNLVPQEERPVLYKGGGGETRTAAPLGDGLWGIVTSDGGIRPVGKDLWKVMMLYQWAYAPE